MKALRSLLPQRARMLQPTHPLIDFSKCSPEEVNPHDNRSITKLQKPIPLELMDKMDIGVGNSYIYRFALPGRERCLGHYTC